MGEAREAHRRARLRINGVRSIMTAEKKEKEGWRGEMIAVLRQSASTSFELPEFEGPSVRSRTLPLHYPAKRRSSSSRSFLPYTLLPTLPRSQ